MARLHCSFCGKSEAEVRKLAAGPGGVRICDECVAACQVLMAGEGDGPPRAFDPSTWPTERLLALLGPAHAASELHRAHLQTLVETLRAREVSWGAVAAGMGVSRQTAWERFS